MFAGFLEQTDSEIGRFEKALEDIGELDNTLFIYIAGDNGTSAEGGFVGMYNEMTYFNGVAEKVEEILIPLIDKWGGPETFPHMAAGWAVAFDTPFTWTKQVASDSAAPATAWSSTGRRASRRRAACARSSRTSSTSRRRSSRRPACRSPRASTAQLQTPIEGTSLLYTFNDAKAPERHTTQYFEMFGNRAIYSDGWLARTIHRAPWEFKPAARWKPTCGSCLTRRADFSLANDLAAQQPAKLKELQALFMTEAPKYHVLPLDDRTIERINAANGGRPDVMGGRTSLNLFDGMQGMLENTFMNVKNRSSTITAEVENGTSTAPSWPKPGASVAGACT